MKVSSLKTIDLNFKSQDQEYQIVIGQGILNNLFSHIDHQKYTQICLIIDQNVQKKLFTKKILKKIKSNFGFDCTQSKVNKSGKIQDSFLVEVIVTSGEEYKCLQTVDKLWSKFLEYKLDRKSLVVNIGGGVIGDMGGFAASCYMRGIDFVQVPTTLLSQVDASVGGKTGFDYRGIKNLIGTFAQPKKVLIDVNTLKTLPQRELIAGVSEIIKHGLIFDRQYLKKVINHDFTGFSGEALELIEIIYESCLIKSKIVEQDEKESGLRKILNFGHTIGHAVETYSLKTENPLLHGEAVGLGMLAESRISLEERMITQEDFDLIKKVIQEKGLPVSYCFKKEEVLELIRFDKKNLGQKQKWTLLQKIGEAVFDNEPKKENVESGLQEILSE